MIIGKNVIAFNDLYTKKEKIYPAYVSKYNSYREKQVIFLMIPNKEGWHYDAVKELSVLLRGTTSKHHRDFHCSNCLHSFATKDKLESHKKECENQDFCNVLMLSEVTKILKFNKYKKSDKASFIIYADLECLTEKIDGCKNNPENSSTTKIGEHIPSVFLMPTISSFKTTENKHDVYRGKYCVKKFCESLRLHEMEIINFKKKKMKL